MILPQKNSTNITFNDNNENQSINTKDSYLKFNEMLKRAIKPVEGFTYEPVRDIESAQLKLVGGIDNCIWIKTENQLAYIGRGLDKKVIDSSTMNMNFKCMY